MKPFETAAEAEMKVKVDMKSEVVKDVETDVEMKSAASHAKRLPRLRDALPVYLSHPDNLIYLLPCLGMVAYTALNQPNPIYALWFLAGWFAFLPQEYLSHVFILHFPMPASWKSEWFYRQMYRMHYGHHDFPKRFDLMFIPLWLTLPLAVANWVAFTWITQDPHARLMLLAGLFAGYLFFEWSHLFCHLPYQPRTRLGKSIRNRHAWHHHRNEKHWYSVSWPAIPLDAMGRTSGTLDQVSVSPSARFLGVNPSDPRILACRSRFESRSSGNLECSDLWLKLAKERSRV
jgi:4-hydroxysphinganine ceramide fatty acyl 2-hydroxylase